MKNIYVLVAAIGIFIGCLLGPVIGTQISLNRFEKSQAISPEDVQRNKLIDERIGKALANRVYCENYWDKK